MGYALSETRFYGKIDFGSFLTIGARLSAVGSTIFLIDDRFNGVVL